MAAAVVSLFKWKAGLQADIFGVSLFGCPGLQGGCCYRTAAVVVNLAEVTKSLLKQLALGRTSLVGLAVISECMQHCGERTHLAAI
jgi:hypothetical protein